MVNEENSLVFTEREKEVISKKLKGRKLNQQDSNYLSRFVRPKLAEIVGIDARLLLDKLEYNQKARSIESKIKKIVLANLEEIEAIVIFGSAIQNNYKEYNDIDVLVVVKNKFWKKLYEKIDKIIEIKKIAKEIGINLDLEIYDKRTVEESYPHSPTLIYQLEDHKVIYGKLKLKNKIELYNIDLRMQLDWSDIENFSPSGNKIYKALRNVVLVRLLLNKIVDNKKLRDSLNDELGKNLIERLKANKASKREKNYALKFLNELSESTRNKLKGDLWGRIKQ